MDSRKLSSFIIGFGLVVMIPGILTVLGNLPLPAPPPPSAQFSWQQFMDRALDPRKSATGVALINMDRAEARAGGFKTIGVGIVIVFAGTAIRMSAKPMSASQAARPESSATTSDDTQNATAAAEHTAGAGPDATWLNASAEMYSKSTTAELGESLRALERTTGDHAAMAARLIREELMRRGAG